MVSALAGNTVSVYMSYTTGKGIWDALEAKFGVSDADSKLYIVEQLFNHKMVDNYSITEQAPEIHALLMELRAFPCVV